MNEIVMSPPPRERRERWIDLVTQSLSLGSVHTRRVYRSALQEFFRWAEQSSASPPLAFSRATVQAYCTELQEGGRSPSTINLTLAALRKLAQEMSLNGWLHPEAARAIASVPNCKQTGVRAGNWLLKEEARALLAAPDPNTLRGKRDRAILALFLGCALRRAELASLMVGHLQLREGRWTIPDLVGKGKRRRTVAVPGWVKRVLDEWLAAAEIEEGYLFRPLEKGGHLQTVPVVKVDPLTGAERRTKQATAKRLSESALWRLIKEYAQTIHRAELAPHDLRRTTAKLCRAKGGDLEQIQLLLGHASIQTTERYLGTKLNLVDAVNDGLGLLADEQ